MLLLATGQGSTTTFAARAAPGNRAGQGALQRPQPYHDAGFIDVVETGQGLIPLASLVAPNIDATSSRSRFISSRFLHLAKTVK